VTVVALLCYVAYFFKDAYYSFIITVFCNKHTCQNNSLKKQQLSKKIVTPPARCALWDCLVRWLTLFVLQAEQNLKNYGKMLISEVPAETTQLLKLLCTDYRPSHSM